MLLARAVCLYGRNTHQAHCRRRCAARAEGSQRIESPFPHPACPLVPPGGAPSPPPGGKRWDSARRVVNTAEEVAGRSRRSVPTEREGTRTAERCPLRGALSAVTWPLGVAAIASTPKQQSQAPLDRCVRQRLPPLRDRQELRLRTSTMSGSTQFVHSTVARLGSREFAHGSGLIIEKGIPSLWQLTPRIHRKGTYEPEPNERHGSSLRRS